MRHSILAALVIVFLAPAESFSQALPEWARALPPEQARIYKANQLELTRVNNLQAAVLTAISEIVGIDFKSKGFLAALDELKNKANTAGKLQRQIADLEATGRLIPSQTLKVQVAALLVRAKSTLEVGNFAEAELILKSLLSERWGNSIEEREFWLEAVSASANLQHIRNGAIAAADVVARNRGTARADWARVDTQLVSLQVDFLISDCHRNARNRSCRSALEVLTSAIGGVSKSESPLEWAKLRVKMGEVHIQLMSWDAASVTAANTYLREALEVSKAHQDEKLEKTIAKAIIRLNMGTEEYDLAIANALSLLNRTDKFQNPEEWASLSFTVGLGYAQLAQLYPRQDPRRAAPCRSAKEYYSSALLVYETNGRIMANTRINLANLRYSCAQRGDSEIELEDQSIADILPLKDYWNPDTDAASWYHVQAIIGAHYRERGVAKYNMAAKLEDSEGQKSRLIRSAMEDNREARSYYATAKEFYSLNYSQAYKDNIFSKISEIDSDYRTMETVMQRLSRQ